MRSLLRAIIPTSLLLVLTPFFALAEGGSDGGGGHAVLCYKNESIKQRVEAKLKKKNKQRLKNQTIEVEVDLELDKLNDLPKLLDIFELNSTDINSALTKPDIEDNMQTLNSKIMLEVDYSYANYFRSFISEVTSWQHFQAGITEINTIDAVQRIPKNCLVVQIGFFDDSNNSISYDNRIYELMDDANKTAFTLHENIYKMWRYHAVYNSILIEKEDLLQDTLSVNNSMFRDELIKSYGLKTKSSRVIRPMVRYLMSAKKFKLNQFSQFADKVWVYLELTQSYEGNSNSTTDPIVFKLRDKVSGKIIAKADYFYPSFGSSRRLLKPWNFVPY